MSAKGWYSLVVLLFTLTSGYTQGLRVGAAKKPITPQGPVYIAGYDSNRLSAGVHDDLWVRCVVIQAGNEKIALAVCDLIGLLRPDVQAIREMVQAVPKEKVIIATTHVHSGPDTIGLWGPNPTTSGVDVKYMEFLRKTVAECIEEAARNLIPATVTFASAKEVKGISTNARVAAILDTELGSMQFRAEADGKVIATVVNYACHPEVMNTDQITADFPHWLYKTVEEKVGGIALYAQGACGGMVTAAAPQAGERGADNWAEAERMGTELAKQALASLEGAKALEEVALQHKWQEIEVPLENEKFKLALQAGIIPAKGELREGKLATEVHLIRLGPAMIATMPGEVLPNIGFLLKRTLKGEPNFLIGLGNDELGYILCEEDYGLPLYAYETSMSVGSQIGEQLVEAVKALTKTVQVAQGTEGESQMEAVLQEYLKRFHPERAGSFKAVYRFETSGEGGGVWHLKIADQKAILEKGGKPEEAECTIRVPARVLIEILTGKRSAIDAYQSGQLVVLGDVGLAQQLLYLFE